ncbi:Crp/Fnr family transcriptional regulator [Danxiaibacter flavus]|uniref:Crp/Fnr family transcriptional regulator n=1 Tax=Danxiaibacter flavus TaxID=3049108 RepID=A0ABV3ZJ15_9BACT|nr:Crp/Fnr family transcriptional regulator [Chitinophagaceae bacterium DXS]
MLKDFIHEAIPFKQFRKGDVIYRQNAIPRYFYEVNSGEVKIANMNNDGREFIQGLYKSGENFGTTALVCNKPYASNAVANTFCEIHLIPRIQFFQLLKTNYSFHFNITETVCKQLQYKNMMLEEFAIEEGEHRLLTLIHYLMDQKAPGNKTLDTTKQQLADMTGLRVETVIRILKNIEDSGKIVTSRGKIVCLSNRQ